MFQDIKLSVDVDIWALGIFGYFFQKLGKIFIEFSGHTAWQVFFRLL